MDMQKITRRFYPDERKMLKSLLKNKMKEAEKGIKYYHLIVIGLVAILFTYLASIIKIDFLFLVFGTIAVLGYSLIVFQPYEIYKKRKESKAFIKALQLYIDKDVIDVYPVRATRFALAREFEDESDLYIVELAKDKVLYLWDLEYNLKRKFPCLEFEIYENDFFKLLGRAIYPLSEKTEPLRIDKKAKWNYIKEVGTPGHLEIEEIEFDKIIERYNKFI
jgi:hypothetical protein